MSEDSSCLVLHQQSASRTLSHRRSSAIRESINAFSWDRQTWWVLAGRHIGRAASSALVCGQLGDGKADMRAADSVRRILPEET